jgi:protein deglycase
MPKVLVPLAQGCEELEAITIIDLLRRAEIEVVTASRGTVIISDTDLDTALEDDYDMVVLPGGLPGTDYLDNDEHIRIS